jgi:hypothetical protein
MNSYKDHIEYTKADNLYKSLSAEFVRRGIGSLDFSKLNELYTMASIGQELKSELEQIQKLQAENAELKRKLDLIDYYINKSTFRELTKIEFSYDNFSQYTPLEEDGYRWQGFIERFKEIKES